MIRRNNGLGKPTRSIVKTIHQAMAMRASFERSSIDALTCFLSNWSMRKEEGRCRACFSMNVVV